MPLSPWSLSWERRSAARGASVAEIEALYRARLGVFVRVCVAVLGDRDSAIDAVQEGFAAAIKQRESFRGEGTVDAWVWGVVVNAARNHRRARAGRDDHSVHGVLDRLTSRPGPIDRVDDRSAVRDEVAALPERQRLALFLRYYADLDYREIAAALGMSVGTVGSTLNAAHAALRQALMEDVDDE